jgi:uncharacterized protein (TIGR02757 family)
MNDIKEFLDFKVKQYNTQSFIVDDPISIPHQYSSKEDIEIAAFFAALFAWGNRKIIIQKTNLLMQLMDDEPANFVKNASANELKRMLTFVHRTFNSTDLQYYIKTLKQMYINYGGLQPVFEHAYLEKGNIKDCLIEVRKLFFSFSFVLRTQKHWSNPAEGSAAKRMNLFLRWMVRKDDCGVDFGLWQKIPSSALMIPLDLHSGNTARSLGLLKRKQNDWKAVEELTNTLRLFDKNDPVKYDYALFSIGIHNDI